MQEHELGWPVGLGPRLVPSAFQISIWMRASSFTRSWASSGELGHGGSLFLYSSFPCAPPPPRNCSSCQLCRTLPWVLGICYQLKIRLLTEGPPAPSWLNRGLGSSAPVRVPSNHPRAWATGWLFRLIGSTS